MNKMESQEHREHKHSHLHTHSAGGNLLFAFFLNLFFSIIELIGGIFTQSVAILSDALHDFGDSISLGIAWRLEKYSNKGRNAAFSYGHRRFSLIGALLISIILLIGSFFVIYASIKRIVSPVPPKAGWMIVLAVFGFIVNGIAAWRLAKGNSLSEKAVMLHMMEDVLGWAAVLVVSVVMYFFPSLTILDPLLSIGITIWILVNVYRNLRNTFKVLLQGVPDDVDVAALTAKVERIPGVSGTHDLHLWTLDGEKHIMTLHIVYDYTERNALGSPNLVKKAVRDVCQGFGVKHVTIEIDLPDDCPCGFEDC